MHEAIKMHLGGLMEDNLPIPESRSLAEYVAVSYELTVILGMLFPTLHNSNTNMAQYKSGLE